MIVQVLFAAVTAVLAYPVARWVAQGVPSAFISMMAVSTAAGSLIGAIFTYKEKWLPRLQTLHTILAGGQFISLEYQFLSFALTTMITGFASTGTVLIVRSMIVGHLGLAEAGIFDVGWTLSMVYITMALTSFGAYYLPTLSQTNSPTESTLLINQVLRLCMIIYVPLITALVVFIPLLVSVLYSLQFLSSLGIIRWMLLGTYFKAISWIFAMTIFAAADKKTLLWTEAAWMAGFLIFSAISLIRFQTIEWVGLGFTINYALYFNLHLLVRPQMLQIYPWRRHVRKMDGRIINHRDGFLHNLELHARTMAGSNTLDAGSRRLCLPRLRNS